MKFVSPYKNLRVSVADCKLTSDGGGVGKDFYSQPIKFCISLEGTFFSVHEHLSNHARQIARDCRFSSSQETIS